jgi:hypothetical protein
MALKRRGAARRSGNRRRPDAGCRMQDARWPRAARRNPRYARQSDASGVWAFPMAPGSGVTLEEHPIPNIQHPMALALRAGWKTDSCGPGWRGSAGAMSRWFSNYEEGVGGGGVAGEAGSVGGFAGQAVPRSGGVVGAGLRVRSWRGGMVRIVDIFWRNFGSYSDRGRCRLQVAGCRMVEPGFGGRHRDWTPDDVIGIGGWGRASFEVHAEVREGSGIDWAASGAEWGSRGSRFGDRSPKIGDRASRIGVGGFEFGPFGRLRGTGGVRWPLRR